MKSNVIALIIGLAIIVGALVLTRTPGETVAPPAVDGSNVSIVDGVQVIAIDAKGGYIPRKSVAKAGIETVIRFNTAATFDCSAAVRIPSLDISKTLPQSGSTDIPVGVPKPGPLEGSCGMGMYPFEIEFVE